jgi:hypothetical protein
LTPLTYGLTAGIVFGAVAVAPMFRMMFPDKRAAISAAFVERFSIGLVIALVDTPWPSWVVGLGLGILLSLPSALITKATRPILAVGAVGGLLIGILLPYAVR